MYEYNYDMLKSDLARGIERDFEYKNLKMGINNWKEGWQFSWKNKDTGETYATEYFKDVFELLKTIRIEGKTLEEIFIEEEQGADNLKIDFYAPPQEQASL